MAIKHFITFSFGWDGCPCAYRLSIDGEDSILGQVQDKSELKLEGDKDKEDPEDKKARLEQYNGMMKKYPARKLVNALKKAKNKDEYFIYFDQNNLYTYAEELLKAGFTQGLFPLQKDFEFEKNREDAMKFVEENYPDVQIIPFQKVATVEEAKAIVENSEVPMVIQSEGDFVSTICPVDDVEQNKIEILGALDKHAKDYAKGQIILKEKLVKPVEITPQIVFYNGVPVFTDLDIETKNIGTGENNGNQVGCGSNLIIRTELEDKINQIAFPPKVFEMAKERKGVFVWDISLYITPDGIFFGEFCSNRFGYDAIFTEMSMAGGAKEYFNALVEGQNPLLRPFGAAVRVFNLNRQKDQNITVGKQEETWLYEVKSEKEQLMSTGCAWDLGIVTASGDTIEETVDSLYKNVETLTFKEKYVRTKSDFLEDYPTSIIHRFKAINKEYIDVPGLKDKEDDVNIGDEIEKLKKELDGEKQKITSELEEKHTKKEQAMLEAAQRDIEDIKKMMETEYNKTNAELHESYLKEIEMIREEIKNILND